MGPVRPVLQGVATEKGGRLGGEKGGWQMKDIFFLKVHISVYNSDKETRASSLLWVNRS